jgi:hypothetical protein
MVSYLVCVAAEARIVLQLVLTQSPNITSAALQAVYDNIQTKRVTPA